MRQRSPYLMTQGEVGLRTLGVGDMTQRYVDWLNDPKVNRFLETRYQKQDLDSVRAFVEGVNASGNAHLFGIFHVPSAAHIGNIKVGPVNARHLHADVSLFIGERGHWGRGYATAAIGCVTRYAFSDLGLIKLEAGCYEQNVASRRAFEKSGYVVEGRLAAHLLMDGLPCARICLGLTRQAWREQEAFGAAQPASPGREQVERGGLTSGPDVAKSDQPREGTCPGL